MEFVIDSRLTAEMFEKKHCNVLRAIRDLLDDKSGFSREFRESNFRESTYMNSQNHEQPCYLMTRRGFLALTLGFTGAKANQFKEEYVSVYDSASKNNKN